jgi:hypothetical protein
MVGPLAFLLLAGVVVMFDPFMIMGKPAGVPVENKPGIPAHSTLPHTARRPMIRTRRRAGGRSSRTPQNR